MGNISDAPDQFEWRQHFRIADHDVNHKIFALISLETDLYYLGREIITDSQKYEQEIEHLINCKIIYGNPYLLKLEKSACRPTEGYCSQSRTYFMIFRKPYLSLKAELINRKILLQKFSETYIELTLEAGVRALHYLHTIRHAHRGVSSSTIYVQKDRCIVLGDPWLNIDNGISFNYNSYSYPSPEKLLYQNDMIECYDYHLSDLFSLGVVILEIAYMEHMDVIYYKGFRKVSEPKLRAKIYGLSSIALRKKLNVLLNTEYPKRRTDIYYFYGQHLTVARTFVNNYKNKFMNALTRDSLYMSYVQYQEYQRKKHPMTDSLIYRMNSEDPIDFDMNKLKAAEDRQIMPNMMTNLGAASLKPITNNQCVPFIRPESPATRFTVFPTQINAPVYISRPSSNHSIRFPDTKPIAISSNIPFKVATIPGVGFSIKVQPKQPVLFSSFPKKLPQNSSNSMHTLNYMKIISNYSKPFPRSTYNPLSSAHAQSLVMQQIAKLNSLYRYAQSINLSEYRDFSLVISQNYNHDVEKADCAQSKSNQNQFDPPVIGHTVYYLNKVNPNEYFDSHQLILTSINAENTLSEYVKTGTTPERKPTKEYYNSTIKEVSYESPSYKGIKSDYDKVLTYGVNNQYIGQIENGRRNGKGTFYYSDGSYYYGEWKDNKMHGKGSLYYAKGKLAYEGCWNMDSFHVYGKICNYYPEKIASQYDYTNFWLVGEGWESYEGEINMDKKEGQGKLVLANGETYIGAFENDMVHGEGHYYTLEGTIVHGIWGYNILLKEFKNSSSPIASR